MKHTKADLLGAVAELVDLARTNGVSAKEIISSLQPYNFTREELAQHYFIMEGDYTLPDLQELLYEVIKKHEETENDELLDLQYDIEETYVFLGGSLEDMVDWNIDGKNFTQEDAEYTEPQELFDRAKHLEVL
jgi:hypothetical protein